jgi:uncharacterized protein (DUF1697 family)
LIKSVAFLRAVNVGGQGIPKMDTLRRALEDIGLSNVKTVLQSGNAIFEAEAGDVGVLGRKIEKRLRAAPGSVRRRGARPGDQAVYGLPR